MSRSFTLRIAAMTALGWGAWLSPCSAVDFALMFKGGSVWLSEDQQKLEGRQNTFDSRSSRAFALAGDVRRSAQGLALGAEYLYYVNPYRSSVLQGEASTRALLFTAKYYLHFADGTLRSFAGVGIGRGFVSNHTEDADKLGNCTTCVVVTPVQIGGGVEWGIGPFALLAEIKALAGMDGINTQNTGHFDSGYNASGLGLFIGARVLF